jgi:hypothetical protein
MTPPPDGGEALGPDSVELPGGTLPPLPSGRPEGDPLPATCGGALGEVVGLADNAEHAASHRQAASATIGLDPRVRGNAAASTVRSGLPNDTGPGCDRGV